MASRLTLALNHLSYFLLTNLLLALDQAECAGTDRQRRLGRRTRAGRSISTTSRAKRDTAAGGPISNPSWPISSSPSSSRDGSRGTGVTVNSLHPGFVRRPTSSRNAGGMDRLAVRRAADLFALHAGARGAHLDLPRDLARGRGRDRHVTSSRRSRRFLARSARSGRRAAVYGKSARN